MINLRSFFNLPYQLHTHEEGQGPTVVFLHGIASSSANWRYLIPLLNQNFRCISIDLLGFGDSPKPEWSQYTIDDHIRSIRKTIKQLHLQGNIILIGHSLGSLLACRYAALYPKQVKHLIMLSPPLYLARSQINRSLARNTTVGYFKLYDFMKRNKKFTLRNVKIISKLLPTDVLSITEDNWIPFIKTLDNCIEQQTVLTDIADVKCPVNIIYGNFDQFIIKSNLKVFTAMRHVTIHELKAVDHVLRGKYSKFVADLLNKMYSH